VTDFEDPKKPKKPEKSKKPKEKSDWFLRKWFASLRITNKAEGRAHAPFSKERKAGNVTVIKTKGKTWKRMKNLFRKKTKQTT
jgi:hypothetical protein